jgi:GT2 family glycosyltransferase
MQAIETTIAQVSTRPDVSVIIVSLNTLAYLQQAIHSVKLGFKRYTTEIIVVDNGSTDGSVDYVALLPHVRLIANNINVGFAKANNQAFAVAQGQHCFLLNSDAFLHESCGDVLVDFMVRHSKVGLVVPTFQYTNSHWQPSFGSFATVRRGVQALLGIENIRFAVYHALDTWQRSALRPKRVDYGEGAGLLIHDEVRRAIGGLAEDYFFYHEDMDYCLRAAKAGWQTWWVPMARLTHVRGGSLSSRNFEAGLQRKLRSFIQFIVRNSSKKEARLVFFLRYLYHQRLLLTVQMLSRTPVLRAWTNDRLHKYQVVKDVYQQYLPPSRFWKLVKDDVLD